MEIIEGFNDKNLPNLKSQMANEDYNFFLNIFKKFMNLELSDKKLNL